MATKIQEARNTSGLMKRLFACAMLWELLDVRENPMKLIKVSGSSKREAEPIVLTVDQFHDLWPRSARNPTGPCS